MNTKIYLSTVMVWLACVVGYGAWFIHNYLKHPTDSDLFSHTVEFQILAFTIVQFPVFVAILIAILVMEKLLLKKRK